MRWSALVLLAVSLLAPPARAQDVACVQPVEAAAPATDPLPHHRLARGEGVAVAVIDTGVAPHPELGHVVPVADLVSPATPDPLLDCDGHGTVVAGVIRSVAPDVEILSVRQSSAHHRDSEGGTLDTLAHGLHAALDAGARVINISVVSCLDPTLLLDARPLHDALHRAEDDGAVVVAAAGNAGGQCRPDMIVHPASADTVLAVGAVHAEDPHALTDYVLPGADFAAPGRVPVGLSPTGEGWASGTVTAHGDRAGFEGTSFAAPVVSGVAALLLERHPTDSPADIRRRLHQAAEPGHGVVDPHTAVTHLLADHEVAERRVGVKNQALTEPPTARVVWQVLGAAGVAALLIGPVRAGWRRE